MAPQIDAGMQAIDDRVGRAAVELRRSAIRSRQYVKICSLYGAGFFYIPGTDTCIKLGGFLRAEWNANAGGSFTPFVNGSNAFFFRGGDQVVTRTRGAVTFDVREQTEYGTLRSYVYGGWQYTSNDAPTLSLPGTAVGAGGGAAGIGNNSNAYLLRAFVQFAGFTFGKANSITDFFSTGDYSHQTNLIYQDIGGVGINQISYTTSFGNGLTGSVAIEDGTFFSHGVRDITQTVAGTAPGSIPAFANILAAGGPTNAPWDNAGHLVPDFTAALRVDQAWGAAQIAGGLHDNRARYYATTGGVTAGVNYPSDKLGYMLMAGMRFNLPWTRGDTLDIQTQYCSGWSGRCINNSGTYRANVGFSLINSGTIGLRWVDDAYFTTGGGLELPQIWNIYAGVKHYCVPKLNSSLYGGYVNFSANSNAINTTVCAPSGFASGCADWAAWQIGSRTVWSPTRTLDIGFDVLYTNLSKSAFSGGTATFSPGANASFGATQTFTAGSSHVLSAIFRVQRNFWP